MSMGNETAFEKLPSKNHKNVRWRGCSYRNCTMETSRLKPVSMFNFPVYDKPRCYQWITNAQKPNFLDLTVSQLQRKLVCLHHFKDSEFMNCLKRKIKYEAVPTEDGPFCIKLKQEENMLLINLEDIERNATMKRLSAMEKERYLDVKYGDFLMNDVSKPIVYPTQKSASELRQEALIIDSYYKKVSLSIYYDHLSSKKPPARDVPQDIPDSKVNKKEIKPEKGIKEIRKVTRAQYTNKKVKIKQEEKISEPVTLNGNLHTVFPSHVLTAPDKRMRQLELNDPQVETHCVDIEIPPITADVPIFDKELEFQPAVTEDGTYEYPNSNQIFNREDSNTQTVDMSHNVIKYTRSVTHMKKQSKTLVRPTLNKTATKTKLSPEKIAEIVEKRKYNMKLRDIITSCIDKLDEESELSTENKNKKMSERKVGDHLSSDPSSQENMACIETRLQRMKDAFPNKIDTQKIAELKKTYKPSKIKRSTVTQTYTNLHTKKHLYQQISNFLSPEAMSLIYEDLFINKYSEKLLNNEPLKKPVKLNGEEHIVSPSLVPDKNSRQMELNNPQVEETRYIEIEIPPITADVPIFKKEVEFQPAITEQGTYNEYPNTNRIHNIEEYNINTQNVDMSQDVKPINLYFSQEMNPGVNQMVDQASTDTPLLTSECGVSQDMPDISMPTTNGELFTCTIKEEPIFTECTVVENPNISMIGAKIDDSEQEDMKVTVFKVTRNVTPMKTLSRTLVSPTVNKTATKTKLPPEKMAEIVEKRKYNMKLRDIITSCIDKLDEESEPTKLSENKNKKMTERKVGDHLSSDPSSQENIMAYLETLRKEDALQNKIDQNTQRIAEIKNTYKPSNKKSTFTQTYANLETKKQLYQQISKFLSPEANSLIHKEIFINRYPEKLLNNEPPKKRKRK